MNTLKILINSLIHETLSPLLIMTTIPLLTLSIPYVIVVENSDFSQFSFDHSFKSISDNIDWYDRDCWTLLSVLLVWASISIKLPGIEYYGPKTNNGFQPKYIDSGFKFYLISMLISMTIILKYSVKHIYYKIPNFIAILIVFGFIFCLALYIKGIIRPDPGICEISKNPIYDYYWGTELYPNLWSNISLKLLIICRFSIFLWQFIVLIAWKTNIELKTSNQTTYGIDYPITATTILQTVYLAKFFYWEKGYMSTIDTTAEKFGFYIAWGCIAFVPGFYTSTSLYLVKHSPVNQFGFISFIITISLGLLSIYFNYSVDIQRQNTRESDGKLNIWGRPAKVIRAKYTDINGKEMQSLLLCSGFWGFARHMNYTFELMTALFWSIPSLFNSLIPYLYLIYLTILLIHRCIRDDNRCAHKYGIFWQKYRKYTKYQMLPKIF